MDSKKLKADSKKLKAAAGLMTGVVAVAAPATFNIAPIIDAATSQQTDTFDRVVAVVKGVAESFDASTADAGPRSAPRRGIWGERYKPYTYWGCRYGNQAYIDPSTPRGKLCLDRK